MVGQRGEVVPLTDPRFGTVAELRATGVPIRMSGSDTTLDRPAPRLGEHNELVLGELLGYSDDRIKDLMNARVV
jgi:crotonobetainyl-CoA:carnitine CoA-transferase CaiB-like acyl-CoA transferase